MKIEKNTVVSMDYEVYDDEGELIDSTGETGPIDFIFGIGAIVYGLEKALEGKTVGEAISVAVSPEDAYGDRDEELVFGLPRESFADIEDLEPGMQLELETEGEESLVSVIEVGDTDVLVDGNHPLAGVPLKFEVTIRSIRSATADEIEHGHPHGEGCMH